MNHHDNLDALRVRRQRSSVEQAQLTAALIDAVRAAHADGMSLEDIVDHSGLTASTVRAYVEVDKP